ncbi:hypothetical protein TorRG33x02_081250 [Trema orientale]|uniref:Transmembrane protein n=1 Tax=Trema orientale TaxID=63057 RepID=A0A2P5FEG9_TREOI|nr:hypothetical protein TorRG33x02_081250 [Trema orientale]
MKNPWGVVVFMGKRPQEAFYFIFFLFGPSLLSFPRILRNWWRQVMVSSLGARIKSLGRKRSWFHQQTLTWAQCGERWSMKNLRII